jgi:hypothetical protein
MHVLWGIIDNCKIVGFEFQIHCFIGYKGTATNDLHTILSLDFILNLEYNDNHI